MTIPFSRLICPSLGGVFTYAFNVRFLRKGLAFLPPLNGSYYPTTCNIIEMVEVEPRKVVSLGFFDKAA